MKVLIFASWYHNKNNKYLGIFIREQAEALQRRGHNVSVLYIDPYLESSSLLDWEKRTVNKVNEYRLSLPYPLNRLIPFYLPSLLYPKIQGVIRKLNPDIIHAHATRPAATLITSVPNLSVPVVVTEHKGAFEDYWITRLGRNKVTGALSRADKVWAVSNYLKKKIVQDTNLKVDILPNCVDTNLFNQSTIKNRTGYLCISNLVPDKRVDWVIRAFATLRDNQQKLYIVGQGSESSYLKKIACELGCEERVIFMGALDRDELSALMKRTKCLLHASKYETFCMVCFEALATGMDVIISRCGGPEEFLSEEQVNYFDSFSNFCLILKKYNDDSAGLAKGRNVSKFIQENFSIDFLGEKLEQGYKEILSKKKLQKNAS